MLRSTETTPWTAPNGERVMFPITKITPGLRIDGMLGNGRDDNALKQWLTDRATVLAEISRET